MASKSNSNNNNQSNKSNHFLSKKNKIEIPQSIAKFLIKSKGNQFYTEDDDLSEDEYNNSGKETEKKLYCICRKEYNENEFMIECNSCREWYHGKCIDLEEEISKQINKYFCFKCRKNSNPCEGFCELLKKNNEEENKTVDPYNSPLIKIYDRISRLRYEKSQYLILGKNYQEKLGMLSKEKNELLKNIESIKTSKKNKLPKNSSENSIIKDYNSKISQNDKIIIKLTETYKQVSKTIQSITSSISELNKNKDVLEKIDPIKTQSIIILSIRKKAIISFLKIIHEKVLLSQKLELEIFNKYGRGNDPWNSDFEFNLTRIRTMNDSYKYEESNKDLFINCNYDKGFKTYCQVVNHIIYILGNFFYVRKKYCEKEISPKEITSLNSKDINNIELIGSVRDEYRRKCCLLMDNNDGIAFEKKIFYEIWQENPFDLEKYKKICENLLKKRELKSGIKENIQCGGDNLNDGDMNGTFIRSGDKKIKISCVKSDGVRY